MPNVNIENKLQLGEIFTPSTLIQNMLDLLPTCVFENPNLVWLDPGCGEGQYAIAIYDKLFNGLNNVIKSKTSRRKHIIEKMIYMIEINEDHKQKLTNIFGNNANIIIDDFIGYNFENMKFDIIIGNPPYNFNGCKKVPTNNKLEKIEDGQTPWIDFVKKSIRLLRPNGFLDFIIPSIWMKPDKAKMYQFILNFKLHNLKAFSNTETNKIFSYSAQTPTCYFLLEKCASQGIIPIYDNLTYNYINYNHLPSKPLPVLGVSIINKMQDYIKKVGHICVVKTNLPSKHVKFKDEFSEQFPHKFIHTCILNKSEPKLVIKYGNQQDKYHNKPKLILAHKMYGFPYLDYSGIYGISNRDNYVITHRTTQHLRRLKDFLSTYFALFIYESTRYRMKYLEKYAFELMPDISEIENFPEIITDDSVANFFGLSVSEKEYIVKFYNGRCYSFEPTLS